jgi:hypothetical protein
VSFEPDKVTVSLDGARLTLEPGQNVASHGVDRDLAVEESQRRPARRDLLRAGPGELLIRSHRE